MQEIDDNAMNLSVCRKYCGTCPTYKLHNLHAHPPQALFCARGKSAVAATLSHQACNCFECDIFKKTGMHFGYYCKQVGPRK